MLNQKQILNRRHWVFDMDGTLTVAAHNFDQIREELGLEPGIPIVKALDSMPPEKANPLRERLQQIEICLLYTSPSPRDKRQSRMPSSA